MLSSWRHWKWRTIRRASHHRSRLQSHGRRPQAAGHPPGFDLALEPIEAAAKRAAELFVSIERGLESRRVAPAAMRSALQDRFAGTLGENGVGLLSVLDEFERLILPDCMTTPHPLYLGLVNSSPLPAAVLADLFISALNNNGGAFHQSPAMTACEEEVVRLFLQLFGFTAGSDGMILPGGSFANLQALVLARSRAFPDGELRRPRVYASEAAHFSVARAAFTLRGIYYGPNLNASGRCDRRPLFNRRPCGETVRSAWDDHSAWVTPAA